MRLFLLFSLLLTSVSNLFATAYTSTQSGLFSAGSTWVGGTAPSADGDTWTIAAGHTVFYDYNNSAQANGWGASAVTGTLWMTNGCFLAMNGNISGAGSWFIGTNTAALGFSNFNLPMIQMRWKSGSCTMSTTGAIQWNAITNTYTDYITNTTSLSGSGDYTNLFFANTVSGVASNDVVYISDAGN